MNKEIHKAKNNNIIYPLYHIIHRGAADETILEWIGLNGDNYTNKQIKNTLRKTGREDFIKMIIQEEDIEIDDSIKSRMTSRVGKVIGIHADGDTIEVKWDEGGRQFLSKESVYKLSGGEIKNPSDLTKVKTTSEPYADMNADDKSISDEIREKEKRADFENEQDYIKIKSSEYDNIFDMVPRLREIRSLFFQLDSREGIELIDDVLATVDQFLVSGQESYE